MIVIYDKGENPCQNMSFLCCWLFTKNSIVSQIVVILVNREVTVGSVNWPQVSGCNSQNFQ